MTRNKDDNKAIRTPARVKTAGEVRFIKDRGGDEKSFGWNQQGPSKREMSGGFEFDAKNIKPLAEVLRATLMSMGHALSAYNGFTRLKSAQISPDGALGGKGYIQKISDMRRAYMNAVEALSALSDTIHDELQAPHWNPAIADQSNREREQVKDIMSEVQDLREDPEGWAEEIEDVVAVEFPPTGKKARKTASRLPSTAAARVAARYMTRSAE